MASAIMEHLGSIGWETAAVFRGKGGRADKQVGGVHVYRRRSDADLDDLVGWCDVIITHLSATPNAKRLGAKYGKPVVQLIHNTNQYTMGFMGSGCDMAIYNSEWVKDTHHAKQSNLIQVIECGNKVASFKLRHQHTWPHTVFHPPAEEPYIGNAASGKAVGLINLVPNKGPDVFYALAEMNPEIQFMGVIGGYEPNHQVIRELPNVTIHEHVSDINIIYDKMSVLLVPSIYESYGRVAIEAYQRGIPVIASPTPGLQEALGHTGWFRDREDIAGWNEALHSTLDNYELRKQSAANRYADLYQQTQAELIDLPKRIEEAVDGYYHNK